MLLVSSLTRMFPLPESRQFATQHELNEMNPEKLERNPRQHPRGINETPEHTWDDALEQNIDYIAAPIDAPMNLKHLPPDVTNSKQSPSKHLELQQVDRESQLSGFPSLQQGQGPSNTSLETNPIASVNDSHVSVGGTHPIKQLQAHQLSFPQKVCFKFVKGNAVDGRYSSQSHLQPLCILYLADEALG